MINLRETYGSKYRITYDDAYDPKGKKKPDPSMMQIPCKRGTIWPYNAELLAIEIDYHSVTSKKLAALGLQRLHDGEHEKTFLFPVKQFRQVASLVSPRRKKTLSETQRQVLAARMRVLAQLRIARIKAHESGQGDAQTVLTDPTVDQPAEGFLGSSNDDILSPTG